MMVTIGTRVAAVNIAFYSSRNVALIERKMFQYTTLSIKRHHCTLTELKTQVFKLSDVLLVSQYTARITQTGTF